MSVLIESILTSFDPHIAPEFCWHRREEHFPVFVNYLVKIVATTTQNLDHNDYFVLLSMYW